MIQFSDEDVGNIALLEHVNLQVPDQTMATIFYILGIGSMRDPYFNIGVRNMWANAGEPQFHFPIRLGDIHFAVMLPLQGWATWRWAFPM